MTKISLRGYNREIENLLDQGQFNQGIAHCHHILGFFPKHIETYRLLGKAHLENQRLGDAADIFQRVLSSVPDDFVAHIGMSIIREDEGNLDASIWHMERAYDVQASNTTIIDELKRLYARRDGIEPPQIRLTRGALARQYVLGGLIDQAIRELRSVLAEDPERVDLQAMLAKMYHQDNQRVNATQTCSKILAKLPYCLEALTILIEILKTTNRTDDAKKYADRAKELEPYSAFIAPEAPTASQVPDGAITLTKLDWENVKTESMSETQPTWVSSIGMEGAEEDEEEPDWMTPVPSAKTEDVSSDGDDFFSELTSGMGTGALESTLSASAAFSTGSLGAPAPADDLDDDNFLDLDSISDKNMNDDNEDLFGSLSEESEEEIPDFMKDAGWSSRDTDQPEQPPPPVQHDTDPEPTIIDDDGSEAIPAEIPDWLQAMAPKTGELDEQKVPQNAPPSDDIPDWLSGEEAPNLGETQPSGALALPQKGQESSEIPDWLSELDNDSKESAPAGDGSPDWLSELDEDSNPEEDSLPDWLGDLGEGEAPDKTADTSPVTNPEDELPDWLNEMADDDSMLSEPLDLTASGIIQPPATKDAATEPATSNGEAQPDTVPATSADHDATVSPTSEEELAEDSAHQKTGLTDWLDELDSPEGAEESGSVTGWLNDMDNSATQPHDISTLDEDPESAVDTLIEPPLKDDEKPDAPEWLQGYDSELLDKEDAQELPATETPSDENVPVWLQGLDSEILAPAADETQQAKPPATKEETIMSENDAPVPDMEDEDDAMAWLESLAAKQGANEDELLTSVEARADSDTPDWLQDTPEEQPAPEEQPTTTPEPVATQPTEEDDEEKIPDWLTEMEDDGEPAPEQPPVESLPAIDDSVASLNWLDNLTEDDATNKSDEKTIPIPPTLESADVPDWLQETTISPPPAPAEEKAEESFDEGDAMAWLENLAAKQGANEDELLTNPDDRTDEAIKWESPAAEEEEPTPEPEPAPEPVASTPTDEAPLPDWLTGAGDEQTTPAPAKEPEPTPEPEPASEEPVRSETEASEWLDSLVQDQPAGQSTAPSGDDVPDWLKEELDGTVETPATQEKEEPTPEPEPIPEPVAAPPEEPKEDALPDWITTDEKDAPAEEYSWTPADSTSEPETAPAAQSPTPKPEATPAPPPPEPVPLNLALNEARNALGAGNIGTAIGHYNALIKKKKNLDQIIADIKDALEYKHPVNIDLWQTLGDAYAKNNDLQDALDAYTKAEELL